MADPSIKEQIAAVEREAVNHSAIAEADRAQRYGNVARIHEPIADALNAAAATLRSHAALEAKVKELEAEIASYKRVGGAAGSLLQNYMQRADVADRRATAAEAERDRARADEREACAQIASGWSTREGADTADYHSTVSTQRVAAAIRARSTPAPVKEGA